MDQSRGSSSLPKRPTLQDVAAAAHVSVMTVSRALRGSANVSPHTRDRILAEAERLGYRGSFSARTLRTGETRLISVLSPNLAAPLHIEIIQGARDAAAQHGYRLLLHIDTDSYQWESAFPTDGDLIMDLTDDGPADPSRAVSLMRQRPDIDYCGTDLPGITRDTVLYLHAAGYRQVALIQSVANDPLAGWLEAFPRLGLPVDRTLLREVERPRESIVEAVRSLTSRRPGIDALIVAHTAGTPIALEEVQRQGLVIGRDLGCVGLEVSTGEWAKIFTPQLTTIRIPGYAIGWAGATRLVERLRGDDSPPQKVELPSELVIRQSTPGTPRQP
jgi:LacI family transcriptional regulator